MKFFVNFLSAFRITAAFLIIITFMLKWFWVTFILYALGAASDWFDGFLALLAPVWEVVIPVIIMIARELYISGLREFLGTQKIEMPVPKARFSMGKIKTTVQMIAITAFLLWFAVFASINQTQQPLSYFI